jgi:CHAD domain-containing protein
VGYRFERDETVGDAFRRIARTQSDKALDEVGSAAANPADEEAIHDCRKRCKKLRGLIRLVRPALDQATYRAANEAFRDAARELSGLRDAQALLATFDSVVAVPSEPPRLDDFESVRAELVRRAGAEPGDDAGASTFERAGDLLRAGHDLVVDADLHADGWGAVRGGLAQTYRRGRDALEVVYDDPTPDNFHELRKRAKYSWYHLRLLGPSAPAILDPLAKQFERLAEGLGDAHDLAVLRVQLDDDPDSFGGEATVHAALELLDQHREKLEHDGVSLAEQLYAEPPKPFARRLERYWDAW